MKAFPHREKTMVPAPSVPAFPPPYTVGRPDNLVSTGLAAYNACVESSPWHEWEGFETPKAEPPPGNGEFGVTPSEGALPFPSNNELYLGTIKSCLQQHPMAGLAPGVGLPPGDVF